MEVTLDELADRLLEADYPDLPTLAGALTEQKSEREVYGVTVRKYRQPGGLESELELWSDGACMGWTLVLGVYWNPVSEKGDELAAFAEARRWEKLLDHRFPRRTSQSEVPDFFVRPGHCDVWRDGRRVIIISAPNDESDAPIPLLLHSMYFDGLELLSRRRAELLGG